MTLNPTETLILKMTADGHVSKVIGAALKMKHCSVEQSRARMFRKLGVKNSCEMVAFALRNQLIK
jgi:DNA-binding NarL/FixJ family response regulator